VYYVLAALYYQFLWLAAVLLTSGYLLTQLITVLDEYYEGNEPTIDVGPLDVPYRGVYYAGGFLVGEFMRQLAINRYWAKAGQLAMRLRAALSVMIYRKATRLRRTGEDSGKIINLLQNGCDRIRDACLYGCFLVISPVTVLAIIVYGYFIIGPAFFAGLFILVTSVPLQGKLSKLSGKLRRQAIAVTDERVNLMGEVMKGIQLIKLFGWEDSFSQKISEIRKREIAVLKLAAYLKGGNDSLTAIFPVLISLTIFIVHTAILGEELTVTEGFVTLSLFNISRFPIQLFSLALRSLAEARVAIDRITIFLVSEELNLDESTTLIPRRAVEDGTASPAAIRVNTARFTWRQKDEDVGADIERDLCIDSLVVAPGQLVCVVGPIGSGKSSLLCGGLLGEMRKTSGLSELTGSLAYVGQSILVVVVVVVVLLLMLFAFLFLLWCLCMYVCVCMHVCMCTCIYVCSILDILRLRLHAWLTHLFSLLRHPPTNDRPAAVGIQCHREAEHHHEPTFRRGQIPARRASLCLGTRSRTPSLGRRNGTWGTRHQHIRRAEGPDCLVPRGVFRCGRVSPGRHPERRRRPCRPSHLAAMHSRGVEGKNGPSRHARPEVSPRINHLSSLIDPPSCLFSIINQPTGFS
jgi:hypothetical protein